MESVFEKIINKLNERIEYHEKRRKVLIDFGLHEEADKITDRILELNFSKNAVEQAAAECNNGWIPCSSGVLPKHSNLYCVTKMCENDENPIYDTCNEIFWTNDNKWDCERDEYCEWKVIAWKPKDEPYQPKGE